MIRREDVRLRSLGDMRRREDVLQRLQKDMRRWEIAFWYLELVNIIRRKDGNHFIFTFLFIL